MIRILVVDDQSVIRQALQVYLENESDLKVVGHADDGLTALEKIEDLSPDIALIDLDMPGMDGLTTTKIITQRFTQTKVLVFSSHDREEYITDAVQAGAKGYLLKSTPAEELASTLRYIHKGYFHLGPGLFEKIITKFSYSKPINETLANLEDSLHSYEEKIATQIHLSSQQLNQDLLQEFYKFQLNFAEDLQNKFDRFEQHWSAKTEDKFSNLTKHLDSNPVAEKIHEKQDILNDRTVRTWESQRSLERRISNIHQYLIGLIVCLIAIVVAQAIALIFLVR